MAAGDGGCVAATAGPLGVLPGAVAAGGTADVAVADGEPVPAGTVALLLPVAGNELPGASVPAAFGVAAPATADAAGGVAVSCATAAAGLAAVGCDVIAGLEAVLQATSRLAASAGQRSLRIMPTSVGHLPEVFCGASL
jgi:hypothetical protein